MQNGEAVVRNGTLFINACLAQGCKIVRDPRNILPEGIYTEDQFEDQDTTEEHQEKQERRKGKRKRLAR